MPDATVRPSYTDTVPRSALEFLTNGDVVSTFTAEAGQVTLSERSGPTTLTVADFLRWQEAVGEWAKECRRRYGFELASVGLPPQPWRMDFRAEEDETSLIGAARGVTFRVNVEDGAVTLRPRDAMTLTYAEFAWFVSLHARLLRLAG